MSIHPGVLSPVEQERLGALYTYNILDTPPEDSFDNLTKLASQIFTIPIVLISFIDEKRQWVKSSIGTDVKMIPRDQSFCAQTILGTSVLQIPDLLLDERFSGYPSVIDEPCLRYYCGMPLIDEEGFVLGTLAMFDL